MSENALDLCDFLWHDRLEPYYEVDQTVYRTRPVSKPEAYSRIQAGYNYFAPVPRITQGNTKDHCARFSNALWCDIDYRSTPSMEAMVSRCYASLGPYDLYPSAVVFSGNRGLHLYFKIDRHLPITAIELLNKRLATYLDGDPRAFDRTRLLRAPGTVNAKSGRRVEILDMPARIFSPGAFDVLLPLPTRKTSTTGGTAPVALSPDAPWRVAANSLGGWAEPELRNLKFLPDQFQIYMTDLPAAPWSRWGYRSRSEIEAQIISRLIGKGWGASDDQVKKVADEWLAKHREMPDDRYLDRTIASARAYLFDSGWISSPLGGYPRRREARYRHVNSTGAVAASLALVRGQPVTEWIGEISRLGLSRSTAYRLKDRLRDSDAVEIVGGHVLLTGSADTAAAPASTPAHRPYLPQSDTKHAP